jgi:hypothetical protein
MEQIFIVASLWLGLAVISAVIAYHLRISIALVEICVGVITAAVAAFLGKTEHLGSNQEWLRFLAASGAKQVLKSIIIFTTKSTKKHEVFDFFVVLVVYLLKNIMSLLSAIHFGRTYQPLFPLINCSASSTICLLPI